MTDRDGSASTSVDSPPLYQFASTSQSNGEPTRNDLADTLLTHNNDANNNSNINNDHLFEVTQSCYLVCMHGGTRPSAITRRRRRALLTLCLFLATAILFQTVYSLLNTSSTPNSTSYFTAATVRPIPVENLDFAADADPWLDRVRSQWTPRYKNDYCADAARWEGHEAQGPGTICNCQVGWIGLECNIPVPSGFTEPSFIVLGVQKGGTSSAHRYLKDHPAIISATKFHFFDEMYQEGMQFYIQTLVEEEAEGESDGLIVGTGAPKYVYDYAVAQRLYYVHPNAKLIVLMREPLSRMWSAYNFNKAKRPNHKFPPFEDLVEDEIKQYRNCSIDWPTCQAMVTLKHSKSVGRSLYYHQLKHYLRYFQNPHQYLLLQSERMFAETQNVLDEISDFLGIPRHNFGEEARVVYNKTPTKKKATSEPSPRSKEAVNEFMAPHTELLYELMRDTFNTTWTWPYVRK